MIREITSIVSRLVQTANRELPQDVELALLAAREKEWSQNGRLMLDIIVENAGLARQTGLPICHFRYVRIQVLTLYLYK
jgi:fumarate hydratase subunit alpha